MQKRTKSLLEELSSMPLKRDKEDVVESRASHILESAIRLLTYIRENFDQDTAFKLEKRFNSAIKNMGSYTFFDENRSSIITVSLGLGMLRDTDQELEKLEGLFHSLQFEDDSASPSDPLTP